MRSQLIYVVSFVLHAGGGALLTSIRVERPPEPTVIEMRTVERPKPKPVPPPPEPPKAPDPAPPPPKAAPPKAAAPPPPPTAAPAAAAASVPDFGLSLGGGGGPGGIAVPTGRPAAAAPPVRQAAKALAPPAPAEAACEEADSKATPINVPHPAYTDEARAAAVEGKVRVELTVDTAGKVASAKVLAGLGHGLDEAALAAVRNATFNPAKRCGKAVTSTFVISLRFAL
jgi:protein TonB